MITKIIVERDTLKTRVADLEKQRDELLAALEHILAGALTLPRFAEEQAKTAIARVRGGAA